MDKQKLLQLILRWLFVVVPTAVIGYITLRYINFSYTAFNSGISSQAVYFTLGLLISYTLYFFRARWLITFAILWVGYWLIGKIIVKLPGEFDVFYATARFQLLGMVFLIGWLFGFLLMRVRFAYLIVCGILAAATLVTTSNTIDVSLGYILVHLVPVVVYGLYMLFLSPVLREGVELDLKKSGRLLARFAAFLILVIFAFVAVESLLKGDLQAVEKELAARGAKDNDKKDKAGYDERYGLMEQKDNAFKLKDTMRINSKMSQSDKLMFCSRLDKFFPDGSPMPMYYVYHYLTKYDQTIESFTRDADVPYFDEFDMDPSSLPMYHARQDSAVIRNSLSKKARSVVESQIYLAANTWKHALLAPAGAYYVQTIPVEKDFQSTFLSAYKVRSYASDLNNAYFVYNPTANPMLAAIQEERHEELRTVDNYRNVDKAFMEYYSKMPNGVLYDSISKLAHSITKGIDKPVDKVVAIQNYFMQKDENGKRIFTYTLKPGGSPGDPNIPTATMLGNFLFKTHAGYCTYYAGASLFLLRSLGIPARFTTGFATINRSDKNKGWYWFYASQAHAWTQVYFPGYGWLDFDMTIGNEDQQSAPKPDGTPPLPPPDAWLVLNGVADSAPDLAAKTLDVSFSKLIYFDRESTLSKPVSRTIDASLCRVLYDKKDTTLSTIKAGDSVVVVSYKDDAKRIPKPRSGLSIEQQIDGFPKPIVADEIHIKSKDAGKKDEPVRKKKKEEEKGMTAKEIITLAAKIFAGAILLMLLLPMLFFVYLMIRLALTSDSKAKADRAYQAALYRFHMAGVEREGETPLDYAETKVDPIFNARFGDFMNVYLRLKYGSSTLREGDQDTIDSFAASVGPAIRSSRGFFNVFMSYFNVLLALRYFQKPDSNEFENQSPI
jgi:transglutaminase-like putative cysteine protease